MEKTEILIVTANTGTTTAESIYNITGWNNTRVATGEEAIEKFNLQNFDVALIDQSIDETAHNKIRAIFGLLDPSVIILTFNTEDKDVTNNINNALKIRDQKNRSFVINDDVFKEYRLN